MYLEVQQDEVGEPVQEFHYPWSQIPKEDDFEQAEDLDLKMELQKLVAVVFDEMLVVVGNFVEGACAADVASVVVVAVVIVVIVVAVVYVVVCGALVGLKLE